MRIKSTNLKWSCNKIREIVNFVRPNGIKKFDIWVKNSSHGFAGTAYCSGTSYHERNCPHIVCRIASNIKFPYINHYLISLRLSGYCGLASFLLYTCFKRLGIEGRLCYGTFKGHAHAWVETSDTVYDLTIRQFDDNYPDILVTSKDAPIYKKYHF